MAGDKRKRLVGAGLGVVAGVGLALLFPDAGLGEQGVRCLAVLAGAIVWWVAGVLPEWATGLLMVVLFSVFGGVGVDVSLSAFTGGTWWLLVGGFTIGAGMKRSGLMRRMAVAITRAFPRTFAAQSAGLMAAGTVIGPLIPSLAAKVTILEPIALSIGESMGYEKGGKQMQGLFEATLTGVRTIGPAAVTASIDGYALLAVLPAATQERFDLLTWFAYALPWLVVALVLTYVCIQVMYRPRGEAHSKATGAGNVKAVAATAAPGPMSREERFMLAIVLAAIVLWISEPLHHVPAHIVALGAIVCMVAAGVLDTAGMRADVNWPSLVFIGTMIGMAQVFAETGIEEWIVGVAEPAFFALSGNPYLFVIGIGALTIALRFLIVSEVAYINIIMALLVPLALAVGIEPWVVGITVYATLNPWFVPYQNPIYLAAYYAVDGKMTTHAQAAGFSAVYLACCLVALVASVPFWQLTGLI